MMQNPIMGMSAIQGLESVSRYANTYPVQENAEHQKTTSFDALLDSAVKLINETDDYSNAAEEEEIKFATGESDSLHDLMIAQQKANISLQYTVAVKNAVVESYRTLMNMQF